MKGVPHVGTGARALVQARALVVLLVVTAVALLSGCSSLTDRVTATVPTTGPIEQGEQVGVDPEDQFIRVIARGPSPGMSATEIVAGFLEASASFDDGHEVARQYLTPAAQEFWNPGAGVRVYDGAPEVTELAQTVVLSAALSGDISENGHLDISPPGQELRAQFGLVRDGGELRINEVPQGLLLSQQDVDRAFRSFAVYYFNPEFDMLVPDARLIPVTGNGLATTLTRLLIGGPSDWLEPAVRTGFPAGVRLNIDAVPVEAGIAQVDLTASAREADDQTRKAMSQQIVWTLRQIPDVQYVNVTAGGQPLTVPGHPSPLSREAWAIVDPNAMPAGADAYAARPEGVVSLRDDSVEPVPGGFGTGEVSLVDIAVAGDESRIAGLDAEGGLWQALLEEDSQPIRIREGGSMTSVAFDRSNAAWVVDAAEGLLAVAGNGSVSRIRVQGIGPKATLLAAVPSRDGTRAALIVQRGPRTVLLLARIVRGANSATSLTVNAPRRVESALAEVVDVTWSSSETLTVLASESLGTLQTYDIDVATGQANSGGAPRLPVSLAAAPGLPTLVGSSDGLVYQSDAGIWLERVRGVAPAYPS